MEPQIVVKNISKSYKTYIKQEGIMNTFKGLFHRKYNYIDAVNDVSFKVNPGEILGLVGLNGAGKTTTIKMVSGIIKQDKGNINILGSEPFKRTKSYRKKAALVMGQKGQLDVDLSIIDAVKLHAAIYGIDKSEAIKRARSMADELNLSDMDLRKQVRSLSLGQRMKGELILSFIHIPVIIFLDEPTLGLDFVTQRSIRNYLKRYKSRYNASIILTSHYINDIEDLCDNIYILNKGENLYYGSIDKLKSSMPNLRKVKFSSGEAATRNIEKHFKFEKYGENEYAIKFSPDKMMDVMQVLSNEKEVSNINFHDDTLDIIIESLYKGAGK